MSDDIIPEVKQEKRKIDWVSVLSGVIIGFLLFGAIFEYLNDGKYDGIVTCKDDINKVDVYIKFGNLTESQASVLSNETILKYMYNNENCKFESNIKVDKLLEATK